MASQSAPTALAQWQRIEGLVQAWLDERQQLVILLYTLQGLRNIDNRSPQPGYQQLQRFCQLLMDYISAGYFEIYRELVQQARHFQQSDPHRSQQIIAQLDASTDEALAFNEDFETARLWLQKQGELPERITHLMMTLEERFALEDQLILSIHQQPAQRGKAMLQ